MAVAGILLAACTSGSPVVGSPAPAPGRIAAGAWIGGIRPAADPGAATFLIVHTSRVDAGVQLLVERPTEDEPPATVLARVDGAAISFTLPSLQGAAARFVGTASADRMAGSTLTGGQEGRFELLLQGPDRPFLDRAGVYRLQTGEDLIVGEQGFMTDPASGDIRTLYPLADGRFVTGSAYQVGYPFQSVVRFVPPTGVPTSMVVERPGLAAVEGVRIGLRREDVTFPSGGITLAGTITFPATAGPYPVMVWVHGSGPATREDASTFALFFARHGVAMLAVDKRGIGGSGGTYPGERAEPEVVRTLAGDVVAAVRFLAGRKDIDPDRIGLFGQSQAGWIIPLAATRSSSISYTIIEAGSTISVDQTDAYLRLTTRGARSSSLTPRQIAEELRKIGPTGFLPQPYIRRMAIPSLWVYGDVDQTIPVAQCIVELRKLAASGDHDFTWRTMPGGGHSMLESTAGLLSEIPTSPRFASGFFLTVLEWLRSRVAGVS